MAKDLMNTQTGGEGETIQLKDSTVNNSEQFVADIKPQVAQVQETVDPVIPITATVPTEQEALIQAPPIPQISNEEQKSVDADSIQGLKQSLDEIDADNPIQLDTIPLNKIDSGFSEFAIPIKEVEPLDFSEFAIPVTNQNVVKPKVEVVKPVVSQKIEPKILKYSGKPDNEYRIVNGVYQKRKIGTDSEWFTIENEGSVSALNKENKTQAKPFNGIYSYTDANGKENNYEYKRVDGTWEKRLKGSNKEFYKVDNPLSINALDEQWGTKTKKTKEETETELLRNKVILSNDILGKSGLGTPSRIGQNQAPVQSFYSDGTPVVDKMNVSGSLFDRDKKPTEFANIKSGSDEFFYENQLKDIEEARQLQLQYAKTTQQKAQVNSDFDKQKNRLLKNQQVTGGNIVEFPEMSKQEKFKNSKEYIDAVNKASGLNLDVNKIFTTEGLKIKNPYKVAEEKNIAIIKLDKLVKSNFITEDLQEAQNFANKDLNLWGKTTGIVLSEQQQGQLGEYQDEIDELIKDPINNSKKITAKNNEIKSFVEKSQQTNNAFNEANEKGVSVDQLMLDKKINSMRDVGENLTSADKLTKTKFDLHAGMYNFMQDYIDNGKITIKDGNISINIDDPKEKKYVSEKLGAFQNELAKLDESVYNSTSDEVIVMQGKLKRYDALISKAEEKIENGSIDVSKGESIADILEWKKELESYKQKRDYLDSEIDKLKTNKRNFFLTEPKEIVKVINSFSTPSFKAIWKTLPQGITSKQKFDIAYSNYEEDTKNFAKKYSIDNSNWDKYGQRLRDALDWENLGVSLSSEEKEYFERKKKLNTMKSLYLNNDLGFTSESAGFWDSVVNGIEQSLKPVTAKAEGFISETEKAQVINEFKSEQGLDKTDLTSEVKQRDLENRGNTSWNSLEGYGGMLGNTLAVVGKMVVSAPIPLGILKNGAKLVSLVDKGIDAKKAIKGIDATVKAFETSLSGTKFGKALYEGIDEGIKMEVAGEVMNDPDKQLAFAQGFFGSVGSKAILGMYGTTKKALGLTQSIFGQSTPKAIKVFQSMSASGGSEVVQEGVEELVSIYNDELRTRGFWDEVKSKYGNIDNTMQLVVSSFIMGGAFGINRTNFTQDTYDGFTPEQRQIVDDIVADVRVDVDEANIDADEVAQDVVENIEKEQEIENFEPIKDVVSQEIDLEVNQEKISESTSIKDAIERHQQEIENGTFNPEVVDNVSTETSSKTSKEQTTPIKEQDKTPTETPKTEVKTEVKQESEVAKEELPTVETPELKQVNSDISSLEEKLVTAKNALKTKAKSLDKAINEDTENLFGERKSTDKNGMFDERVDLSQREKATEKERNEVSNIEKQLSDLKVKKTELESGTISSTGNIFEPTVEEKAKVEEEKKLTAEQEKSNKVVRDVQQYNKLSKFQKNTKSGRELFQNISRTAGEFNYNIDADGKGRLELKKPNGKKVVQSIIKENIAESTQEDLDFANEAIGNGVLNWDGDSFTPRINLGISWADIRKGESDIKAGKTNTAPAKKLVQALAEFKGKETWDFVQGSGGQINANIYVPIDFKTEDDTNYQLTKEDSETINKEANELSLAYDEYIKSLDEETQTEIQQDYEGRNQTMVGEDAEGGKSEKNVSDTQKTGNEKSGFSKTKELIAKIPSEFKGDETIRDYTVNQETDVPLKVKLKEMYSNGEITKDEFDKAIYDIDSAIAKYLVAQKEFSSNLPKKEKAPKKNNTDKFNSGIDNNFNEPLGWENDEDISNINWEASQRRGEAPRFMEWIIDKLGKAFPNIDVHTDRGAFLSNAKRLGKNTDIAGFIDSENGVIYLNPDISNENTAFEEYSHVWLEFAKQMNPSIIEKGTSLLATDSGKKYVDEVMNDPLYSNIHGNKKAVHIEALAKMIADRGYQLAQNKFDKPLINWLKEFWSGIVKFLGIKSGRIDINKDTIETYVDKIAKELLQNKPISLLSSEEFATFEKGGVGFDMQKTMLNPLSNMDKFRLWWKDKTEISKGADKEIVNLFNEVKHTVESYKKRGEFLQKDLQKAVENYLKSKGTNTIESRRELLTEIDRAFKDKSYRPDFFSDANIKNSFNAMRDMVDELSDTLINSGLIAPDSELIGTIQANKGIYIYKQYNAFLSKNYDWRKSLSISQQKEVMQWINKRTQVASSIEYKKTKVGRTNEYEITFVNPIGEKTKSLNFKSKKELQLYLDGLTYSGLGMPFKSSVDAMFKYTEGTYDLNSNISMDNSGVSMPTMSTAELIAIANELSNKQVKGSTDAQKTLTKQQTSLLMKKKEQDPEYDLLMGAVVDPILNFSKTISQQAQYVYKGQLEKDLLESSPFLFSRFETATNTIPITSSQSVFLANKFKDNDGKAGKVWVTPEFYNFMYADGRRSFYAPATKNLAESSLRTEGNDSVAGKVLTALSMFSGLTKKMLTVRSPSSNARNFIGATIAMIKMGHFYDTQSTSIMGKLNEDFDTLADKVAGNVLYNPVVSNLRSLISLTQKDKQANREMIIELVEQGLLNSQIDAGVIKDLQEMYIKESETDKSFVEGTWNKMKEKYGNFSDAENKSYQFSDNLPKAVVYFSLKNTYNETYGNMYRKQGMSEADISKKIKTIASDAVKNQMPTYELTPDLVKAISRNPFIGTFIMYKYQTLRNDGQIVRDTVKLIKDRNEMKRLGLDEEAGKMNWLIAKKVSGLALTTLASTGLTIGALSMLGLSDDDDESLRKVMPDYRKENSILWLNSDKTGKMDYIDLSNVDPQDTWQKLIRAMKDERYLDGIEGVLEPYYKSDIGFSTLMDAFILGEDEFGRPIGKGESWWSNRLDEGSFVLENLTKNSIIGQSQKLVKGFKGEKTDYEEFTKKNELSSWLLGLKRKTIDIQGSFKTRSKTLAYEIEKSNDVLKKKITDNDFSAEMEKEAVTKTLNKNLEKGREMVKGMRKLGLSDLEIRNSLEYTKPDSNGNERQQIKQYIVDKLMSNDNFQLDEKGEIAKPEKSTSSESDSEFDEQLNLDFEF